MRRTFALAALLLAATHAPAHAAIHCVGSVPELLTAMHAISSNDAAGSAVDLRLRTGTYVVPEPAEGQHGLQFKLAMLSKSYRISGGWNAGCTVQTLGPNGATVLDGQGQRGVLQIVQGAVDNLNPPPAEPPLIHVQNLRFANGVSPFGPLGRPGCLDYGIVPNLPVAWTLHPYRLLVENSLFRGCDTALDIGAAVEVTVRNSIFLENFGSTAAINAFNPHGPVYIVNNTFRRNEVIGAGAEVRIGRGDSPAPPKYVVNNVFAESVNPGAPAYQLIGDGLTFVRRNRIEYVTGDSVYGYPFLSGNTAASPIFVGTNDHRLSSASPLRDLGENSATGGVGSVDFHGATRVQGAAVDPGAYELAPAAQPDALFAHGFE